MTSGKELPALAQMHLGIKRFYRLIAPSWMRGSRAANFLKGILYKALPKKIIYDEDFIVNVVDKPAIQAAPVIVGSIVRDLIPRSILDVGCGSGAMLCVCRDAGLDVKGYEFGDSALALCKERGLNVSKVDLRSPNITCLPKGFDVVLSMEVAEHLPPRSAAGYVELLCASAPVIIFTAAPPGQGGTDHLNEQPMQYWVELFRQHSFYPDTHLAQIWRQEWVESKKVAGWYANNLMLFRKAK